MEMYYKKNRYHEVVIKNVLKSRIDKIYLGYEPITIDLLRSIQFKQKQSKKMVPILKQLQFSIKRDSRLIDRDNDLIDMDNDLVDIDNIDNEVVYP